MKIVSNSTGVLIYHYQDANGNYVTPSTIDIKIYDPDGIKIAETINFLPLAVGIYQYLVAKTLTTKAGRYEAHWHTIKDITDAVDIEYFDVVKSEDEYLATIEEIKEFTGITGEDNLMRQLLFSFQSYAEKYCQVKFKPTGIIDERYNGDNTRTLYLKNYPLLDISKVEVVDKYIIPERDLSQGITEGFIADFDSGLIELTSGYYFVKGTGNVLINYVYGYDEIPFDLRQVALEWIGFKLQHKNSLGLKSESLGPYSIAYDGNFVGTNITDVLDNYRRGFGV